ncbi:alanine aminotransferase 2-like isoform X2 [Stegodyphus dumicola]|uniref:alanine aminotransferase 2-like isoform X2 n=1 Tax=Stegodyphus dumicola TaxID=202533 RepID=UPI0015B2A1EA|nr:alanine aminotransferase 2-like isoform X2 [Stegodyphus dumicola]
MISCFLRRSVNAYIGQVSKDLSNSTKFSTHRHSSVTFTTHFRITPNMSEKTVTLDNINPNIKSIDFALLGPMAIRAKEIENELKGMKKPFTEVIKTHIGDCHAMGQKPLTFLRQVLTLCAYPVLMKDEGFPDDVKERARDILKFCGGGSVGSYSDSAGVEIIKKHIAQYIERRDGIPTNYLDIILSSGATQGIQNVLSLFKCSDKAKPSGVMIPIPQYPVYSATIAEYGMHPVSFLFYFFLLLCIVLN